MLTGALALFLRELLVPPRTIFGRGLLLLVHTFAAKRCVARNVSRGLLAAAEQLVEE